MCVTHYSGERKKEEREREREVGRERKREKRSKIVASEVVDSDLHEFGRDLSRKAKTLFSSLVLRYRHYKSVAQKWVYSQAAIAVGTHLSAPWGGEKITEHCRHCQSELISGRVDVCYKVTPSVSLIKSSAYQMFSLFFPCRVTERISGDTDPLLSFLHQTEKHFGNYFFQ